MAQPTWAPQCSCRGEAHLGVALLTQGSAAHHWKPFQGKQQEPHRQRCPRTGRLPPRQAAADRLSVVETSSNGDGFAAGRFQEMSQPAEPGGNSMEEYNALKEKLLRATQRFGTLLTLYVFFAAGGEAAACSILGGVASYGYMVLLMRDIDRLKDKAQVPMLAAEGIKHEPLRTIARAVAGYRHAAQPRLLIPIGLGAAVAAYSSAAQQSLSLADETAMLAGFLSYKVALLGRLWDSLKPKVKSLEELSAPQRPVVPQVENVDDIIAAISSRQKR